MTGTHDAEVRGTVELLPAPRDWSYERVGSATVCYHRRCARAVLNGLVFAGRRRRGAATTVLIASLKHGIVRDCVYEIAC